ncbi:nucleoside phosphorylase domain-containing protein [Pseudoneurospora amorphoporcata]|uniref:Nucleoside phosphorylase domain-containing protein n=1 Tax=Pseudoneurospora amorphoporcata TaxID=241081 RepID=A0AAN6NQH6_9PEZI|nr:nucleoside phosphorylase domain-containing protein [Pseudoneurospora amorphoporcata]
MDAPLIQHPGGFTRPNGRSDFEVAIICALTLEFDAVCLLIDEFWDEYGDRYGKVQGDHNIYTTGRMGTCNVVVVQLPNMGKALAASAAASLRSSYPQVSLALLVGVCGAVPFIRHESGMNAISLGDVIISNIVVQYDTALDSLGRPNKMIRNILAHLSGTIAHEQIEQRANSFLEDIQRKTRKKARGNRRRGYADYQYPGAANDRLFHSGYQHKHGSGSGCMICEKCHGDKDPTCLETLKLSCEELGCDSSYLIQREHLQSTPDDSDSDGPGGIYYHIGAIGSGDAVIRSGKHRDQIAAEAGVIAFEMEGAGVWDELPCIVIKGVCDYADSHKNKGWQNYAAATAASVAKAIMGRYIATVRVSESSQVSDPSRVSSPSWGSDSSPSLGADGVGRQVIQWDGGKAGSGVGAVRFNGNVSGSKLVAGPYSSGGTMDFRFA